jgi:uncharacterized phiE125 gp8 family phage protein
MSLFTKLRRITPPLTEPISLEYAKSYLRIDDNGYDHIIIDMIKAVRELAENYLGKVLITQSWQLRVDDEIPNIINLLIAPVTKIDKIVAVRDDDKAYILAKELYSLKWDQENIEFKYQILAKYIEIFFTGGYGNVEDIPQIIKQGMLIHLANLFENKISIGDLPSATIQLYSPFRKIRI